MERSQTQGDMGDEGAKEVLKASLFLSVLKHTGDGVSRVDDATRPEDVQAGSSRAPRRFDPPVVRRVNALIDSIGQCRGPFEKQVMASDLKDQQNRLILWKDDVREFILPLLREVNVLRLGVEVKVFNTEGKTFPMHLKLWGGKVHVLMGNWKVFVRENQLKESDVLKIWVFRDVGTDGLCFLIAIRRTSKALGQVPPEKGTQREGRKRVESKPRKALSSS